jgi:hypothetical protein
MRLTYYAATFIFVGVLLLGGVLWLAGQVTGLNPFASSEVETVGPSVVESVRELSSLTTVEYLEYTTIEKGRDAGFLNFLRGDKIFLLAVARVGAGIDLSQLRDGAVTVDDERRSVRIELPPAQILYVALDNEATQVFDRDTGLFTKGDDDLEGEARLTAEGVLREQAYAAGILATATENAKKTLTAFLEGLGFTDITIVGAFDEPAPSEPTTVASD